MFEWFNEFIIGWEEEWPGEWKASSSFVTFVVVGEEEVGLGIVVWKSYPVVVVCLFVVLLLCVVYFLH